MLLVLSLWVLIFLVFTITGLSVVKVIYHITNQRYDSVVIKPDEFFFIGFLTISTVAGFLSIFIPIGNYILISVCLIVILLIVLNFRDIKAIVKDATRSITILSRLELLLISLLIIFILTAVVQRITLGDTESYHAQTIQWIRKYAVVPGLGNIHGRLAFNSMFFIISGLFTFQIKDILIFPLNGISFVVLIIKLISLCKKLFVHGTRWKAVFYTLIISISLLVFIPNLNSPSPDIICAILIIYSLTFIINLSEEGGQMSFVQIILLNMVVFSCITFKISSLFLVSTILFLLNKEILKRSLITFCTAIIVMSPFLIRNYYLSGYLIYPFPSLDLFNVDWKIPAGEVISMKLEVENWAKISTIPFTEVANMKFYEWIMPWYKSLDIISRLLVTINIFSLITAIIMILKKDYFLAKIQLIILLNLFFWFIMAPDPRFAYGFIFLGFSLTLAYIVKLVEYSSFNGILLYLKVALTCLLIVIVFRRIEFPAGTIKNPSLWVISAPFGTVPTRDYYSDFRYSVPVPEGGCFNVEIPCVPFPLTDIVMRTKDMQDGFKVVKQNP